jgi:hypothetical protein
MPKFITTIQLHDAEEKDYKQLNTELKRKSFISINELSATEKSKARKEVFNREGNVTLQDVTDAVVRAAANTGKRYSFTIIRNKPVYN